MSDANPEGMTIKVTVREDEHPELYQSLKTLRPRARAKKTVSLAAAGVKASAGVGLGALGLAAGVVRTAMASERDQSAAIGRTASNSRTKIDDGVGGKEPEPIDASELGDIVEGLAGGGFGA